MLPQMSATDTISASQFRPKGHKSIGKKVESVSKDKHIAY